MATGKLRFTKRELERAFPTNAKIRQPRPIQRDAIAELADGKYLQELPTGTGKTALEYMILSAALPKIEDSEAVFWIFPTKALVEQVKREHPDVIVIFGQNEHVCPWAAEYFEQEPKNWVSSDQLPILYDDPKIPRVNEIPHSMHGQCPHYINQETGRTLTPGVVPCPYYQQTHEAKRSRGIIAATMSFYIFAKLFSKRKKKTIHDTAYGRVAVLAIDEVHRFPDVIRYTLSYDVTDWNVTRAMELLKRLGAPEHKSLRKFLRALKGVATAHQKEPYEEHLLNDSEIRRMISILEEMDPDVLYPERISEAVAAGLLDRQRDWQAIKTIEVLASDIRRYIHSFEYALAEEDEEGNVTRRPLNYSCSYYRSELDEQQRVQHKLVIHCHYVAPLIRKNLVAPTTVSFSATIGRPDLFAFESGIRDPFFSAPSTFPIENRRIYLPVDADALSHKSDPSGRKKARTLRSIAKGCRRLARKGIRSLVIVSSNAEREKFMRLADEEGVEAITYGDEVPAKDAARAFKTGDGDVLCGCTAHYGIGVDFPKGTAGAVWLLRPGYPNPKSATTKFEVERYGDRYRSRLAYRVMLEAQQAIGRNIRGPRDRGVCFLMSRQFKDFVYAGLPEWLKPAYRRGMMLDECLADAEVLLASLSFSLPSSV